MPTIRIDCDARSISLSDPKVTLLFETDAQQLALFGIALIALEQKRDRQEGRPMPYVPFSKIRCRFTRKAEELGRGPRDHKTIANYFYLVWLQHLSSHDKKPRYETRRPLTSDEKKAVETIFERRGGLGDAGGEYRVGGDNAEIEFLAGDLPESEELSPLPATMPQGESVYPSMAVALHDLASKRPEVEDLIFMGFTARMLALDLSELPVSWRIKRMRILVRDLETSDVALPGSVPRDPKRLAWRRDNARTTVSDLAGRVRKKYQVEQLDIRYVRGHPIVRVLVVDGSIGWMRLYKGQDEPLDFTALGLPLLKLSKEQPYMRILLEGIVQWFDFVWQYGSYKRRRQADAPVAAEKSSR
jgi:hypothetical protein